MKNSEAVRRHFHVPAREMLLEDPQRWGPALQALYDRKAAQVAGLYSERRVTVRTRDLTIIALEGAAAGVLFAGSTAVAVVLFLRR